MEAEATGKVKPKRVRKAPYRKWSEQEQQQLQNFLRENRPMEKPTAQLFYKRFLNQIGSDLDWTLVRCKVKNLRQSYIKAKSWTNSTGAGTMRDGETTRDVLLRMCPIFDDLEEVFGYREYQANALVIDTEDSNTSVYLLTDASSNFATALTDEASPSPAAIDDEENAPLPETPHTATPATRAPRKGIYSRTALADVLEVHSNLVEVKKEKLNVDREFRDKELLLKEKEFNFEKEKYERKERFKLLEMEMKERIAMKEIEMKERVEMEKLKMQK